MRKDIGTQEEREYNRGYRDGYLDGLAAGRKRKKALPDISEQPIEALGLSTRAVNALHTNHFQRVGELTAMTKYDIWRLRGVGETIAKEITRALHSYKIFDTAWDAFYKSSN